MLGYHAILPVPVASTSRSPSVSTSTN
jgi:hypothetical protein